MIVKSKAGTDRPYVQFQGRKYPGSILHVQFEGHAANREYGAAFNVEVEAEVLAYVEKNKKEENQSLYPGSCETYCTLQARPREDTVHFQVVNGAANRDYGFAFDVPRAENGELWTYLAEEILFNQ